MIWLFPSENNLPRVTMGLEGAELHRSTGGNENVDVSAFNSVSSKTKTLPKKVSSLKSVPSPKKVSSRKTSESITEDMDNILLPELLSNLDMEKVALHFNSINGAYDYAYSLFDTGHYFEAATIYERLFSLSKPCDTDLCIAACAWSRVGNQEMAFKNLYRAVSSGWTSIAYLKEEPALENIRNCNAWEEFLLAAS